MNYIFLHVKTTVTDCELVRAWVSRIQDVYTIERNGCQKCDPGCDDIVYVVSRCCRLANHIITCCAVYTSVTSGGDVLQVTADNVINQVCVDETPVPRPIHSRTRKRLGSVALPQGWSGVNIKASKRRGKSGLLGYLKSSNGKPVGITWSCKPLMRVENQDCCGWNGLNGLNAYDRVFGKRFRGKIPNGYALAWVRPQPSRKRICCHMQSTYY